MPHAEGCELACGSCLSLRWDLGEDAFCGNDAVLTILVLWDVVYTLWDSNRKERRRLQNKRRRRKERAGKNVEAFVRF